MEHGDELRDLRAGDRVGIVPFMVVATTVVALAACAVVLIAALRRRSPAGRRDETPADAFLRQTAVAVAGLSLVAISLNALPALITPPCS